MVQINYDKNNTGEGRIPVIVLPYSKSITARALIISYINGDILSVPEEGLCEDTKYLLCAIKQLGEYIPNLPLYMSGYADRRGSGDGFRGRDGVIKIETPFDLGEGGTTLRFFVALVVSIPDLEVELRCSEVLARRPVAPLLNVLRQRGAVIRGVEKTDYPPFYVRGRRLCGGVVDLKNSVSSQFVSAVKMVEKLWDGYVEYADSDVGSKPYIKMTERMVGNPDNIVLETDWSGAAFFYEALLLSDLDEIEISAITPPELSVQGDSRCVEFFSNLGIETEFRKEGGAVLRKKTGILDRLVNTNSVLEFDMEDTPDLVLPIVVAMAMAGVRFEIVGIKSLAYKESNRIVSLQNECEKIGVAIRSDGEKLTWDGEILPVAENEVIECWNDHRVAMAFAPVAAKTGYITLRGEECVSKSFPCYFEQLEKMGYKIRKILKK